MTTTHGDDRPVNRLYGRLDDVAREAGHLEHPPRVGFFTDTSVCIGCKACEVACKEWNLVPDDGMNLLGMSMDNTGDLGANSWRHVAFIEREKPLGGQQTGLAGLPTGASGIGHMTESVATSLRATERGGGELGTATVDLGMPSIGPPEQAAGEAGRIDFSWLMMSDVCKHCTHAGCLDVCPTGALFRTEFGTVVVQDDICNGGGYCVPARPYGVIDVRESDGGAHKCRLCYDRLGEGLEPACAKACPTQSIQFGNLDELQARADARLARLKAQGVETARLYGRDEDDGVGGAGAFFLLLDEPEVYGLPPDPVVTTRDLPAMWRAAAGAAAMIVGVALSAVLGSRRSGT